MGVRDPVIVVQSPGDQQASEGIRVAAGLDIGGNRAFTARVEIQELLILPQGERKIFANFPR